jgi:hypothetical protein
MNDRQTIDLSTPLSLKTSFLFPLQSPAARSEVVKGGLWLLVPLIGWILNMGHRISMTHRMQSGISAWPAWRDYRALIKHGVVTLLGMIEYHLPAAICELVAWRYHIVWLQFIAAILWIAATLAVPGYMTHYCYTLDASEVFNPLKAMRRVLEAGSAYWHAWAIALAALLCSFLGLLAFGVGFLVTSVWFWQVAGFSFATAFTDRYHLRANTDSCDIEHKE